MGHSAAVDVDDIINGKGEWRNFRCARARATLGRPHLATPAEEFGFASRPPRTKPPNDAVAPTPVADSRRSPPLPLLRDQDIFRVTFKASIDVIRAQGEKIEALQQKVEALERAVNDRARTEDVKAALDKVRSFEDNPLLSASSFDQMNVEIDAAVRRRVDAANLATRGETQALAAALDRANEDWRAELATATKRLNSLAINGAGGMGTREDELERTYATKSELALKSDMKDVCALLDVKVGVDDVNRALAEVSRELEGKASLGALEASIREQGIINAGLAAERSVGRWIWKSVNVKAGNGVPWNVQSVNTDPENFVWEKNCVSIVANAPGLYEVTLGFFVRKKPAIQLLVNGEPVMAAVNSASYVLHHSSGRLTSVGRHTAGNVTGLTLVDFLALPPKARIAVTYNGESGGEGFISLKKL